ncbi:U4/U6.U5 small nuclear ribonucleoprotein 27 kDa protein [Babesia sp. Xinjiang]|uniref:U4/U6.U5 small nuclear ribonucleoprotein 27 kDa protein n=1 Tax=Babesia sp. Xinjiang TaxID=462227 RepID=UPI000A24195B|nr:U4/U6.U5 small nuclear ribonucleoprotein 27 kDa protein [Babesia sp. Xinjiang]ORM41207.1 U4/U6.U5 small nuclear ribonucleoprotein 27 kDa protein [Babesia sp. Xinjiang]
MVDDYRSRSRESRRYARRYSTHGSGRDSYDEDRRYRRSYAYDRHGHYDSIDAVRDRHSYRDERSHERRHSRSREESTDRMRYDRSDRYDDGSYRDRRRDRRSDRRDDDRRGDDRSVTRDHRKGRATDRPIKEVRYHDKKHRDRRRSASADSACSFGSRVSFGRDREEEVTVNTEREPLDEESLLLKSMGFTEFSTTKNKQHLDTDVSGVAQRSKRQYRQYMNRRGGFNRPLSPTY